MISPTIYPGNQAQPRFSSVPKNPHFGSTWLAPHTIQTARGALEVICRTHHFREPKLMKFLPGFFNQKFSASQFPKVKVAVYAGADGSEARSISMVLMEQLGLKKAQRFSFESIDINPKMAEQAQQPVTQLNGIEHKLLGELVPTQHKDLMMPLAKEDFRGRREVPYRVADSVLNMITHRHGDLMKDARQKINAQVLLFRNAWDHLPADKQEELARNLYRNMDEGSVVIIGAETIDTGIRKLLKRVGFSQFRSEGPLSGVFTKEAASNPFAIAFKKANLVP